MRVHLLWLTLACVLLGVCLLQRATIAAPRQALDADIKAYDEPDGSVLIVVNGKFEHRIYSLCGSQPF